MALLLYTGLVIMLNHINVCPCSYSTKPPSAQLKDCSYVQADAPRDKYKPKTFSGDPDRCQYGPEGQRQ